MSETTTHPDDQRGGQLDEASATIGDTTLADPQQVETIVRQFVGGVIGVRVDYISDKTDGDDAMARIRGMIAPMEGIFYGTDPGPWMPEPQWNTTDKLGRFIADNLQVKNVTPQNGVEETFSVLANEVIKMLVAGENGGSEDAMKARSDLLIEQFTNLLAGRPPPK